MKKILIVLLVGLLSFVGCKTVYIPVKETEYVTVRDSVYFRDTVIKFQVEKQYVRDYTGLLDTLRMETDYAESSAWVDTSRSVLAGEIRNREKVVDVPVKWKERIVYKDSLVYKDVPVEVEKIKTVHPKYEAFLLVWFVLSVLLIAFKVYLKLK